MATIKLPITTSVVKRVRAGEFAPRTMISDPNVTGFRIAVNKTGQSGSYQFVTKIGKVTKTLTPSDKHGRAIKLSMDVLTPTEAKDWAKKQAASLVLTAEPIQTKKQDRLKFAELGEQYLVEYRKRVRTEEGDKKIGRPISMTAWQNERYGIGYTIEVLGKDVLLSEVNSPKAAQKIKASSLTPTKMGRAFGATKRAIDFAALNVEGVEFNMFGSVKAPKNPKARDRVLDGREIAALWQACLDYRGVGGDIMRLLIVQPLRGKSEAASLTWGQVDLDDAVITLRVPKTGAFVRLPMSALAIDIIRARLPDHGEPDPDALIFETGRGTIGKPFNGFSKLVGRLQDRTGINNWSGHTWRHTMPSLLAENDEHPTRKDARDAWLSHSQGTTYEHSVYFLPMRTVAAAWDAVVRKAIGMAKAPKNNVVYLKARKARGVA